MILYSLRTIPSVLARVIIEISFILCILYSCRRLPAAVLGCQGDGVFRDRYYILYIYIIFYWGMRYRNVVLYYYYYYIIRVIDGHISDARPRRYDVAYRSYIIPNTYYVVLSISVSIMRDVYDAQTIVDR